MSDIPHNVDKLLESAFGSLNFPKHPGSLYDPVRYIMDMGGKRFRPRLLLLAAGMCGGKPENAVYAARAVEMLHNFTLIHDDIMDNAPARRGRATVHERWDDATAILSGDVLFVMAMQQLASWEDFDGNRGRQPDARMMPRFLDAVQEVCDGQAIDMDFEKREMVPLEEYLQMIRAKTGALIRCSMELGAMSAGADEAMVQQCGKIGEHAGLAFQIQDDLLDAVGDTSKFGKKVGGDITKGKKTWLTILALQRADDTDRILLKQILGDENAKESDVLRVIRIYNDLGVIDAALAAIEEHYSQASQLLAMFEKSDYREEIKTLLDKLKVRDT